MRSASDAVALTSSRAPDGRRSGCRRARGDWSAAPSPMSSATSSSRRCSIASATAPMPRTFSASRSARLRNKLQQYRQEGLAVPHPGDAERATAVARRWPTPPPPPPATPAADPFGTLVSRLTTALKRGEIALALGVVAILVVLILPMPTWLLDISLALSITFSVLILMVGLFIERPLEFSSFPTVLLIAHDAAPGAQPRLDAPHPQPRRTKAPPPPATSFRPSAAS